MIEAKSQELLKISIEHSNLKESLSTLESKMTLLKKKLAEVEKSAGDAKGLSTKKLSLVE